MSIEQYGKKEPERVYVKTPSGHTHGPAGGQTPTLNILLPCPCCSAESPWYDRSANHDWLAGPRWFWSVRCTSCGLKTPAIANPLSCIDIWNTRPVRA